jgi:hypothetical protein
VQYERITRLPYFKLEKAQKTEDRKYREAMPVQTFVSHGIVVRDCLDF